MLFSIIFRNKHFTRTTGAHLGRGSFIILRTTVVAFTMEIMIFEVAVLFILIGNNSVKGGVTETYIDCVRPGYPGHKSTVICRINQAAQNGIQMFRANGDQVVLCDDAHTFCILNGGITGYNATIDQTTRDVTLTIESFNPEVDVGTWTCADGSSTDAAGENTTCYKYELTGPDNITLIPPEPGEVTEGESLDVTCVADCNPPCSFSWMLEQTEISSSSQLHLSNVKLNQNGEVYTCIANNSEITKSESINFTLTVKDAAGNNHSDCSVCVLITVHIFIIIGHL